MQLPLRISFPRRFVSSLGEMKATEQERAQIKSLAKNLAVDPLAGAPLRFDGYPGGHRIAECGRFVLVYQFSASHLRFKAIVLRANYDD